MCVCEMPGSVCTYSVLGYGLKELPEGFFFDYNECPVWIRVAHWPDSNKNDQRYGIQFVD